MKMTWDLRRLALWAFIAAASLLALVLIWRVDAVQRVVLPERFWTGKIVLAELVAERLRDKAVQCAGAAQKLREASAGGVVAGENPVQTMRRLCQEYNDEFKRAVDEVLSAREALRKSRD